MAAAALAVGAAIWATASWLLRDLHSISGALNQANTRIEAVRTALAAGVGTGAAVGLLLAFRRQQHQEVATALTELDAGQRWTCGRGAARSGDGCGTVLDSADLATDQAAAVLRPRFKTIGAVS